MNALLLCTALGVLPAGGATLEPPLRAVSAKAGPTQLVFEVEPDTVVIFVDGKKRGTARTTKTVPVKPGTHAIKLVWNKDETEFDIKVEKGHSILVKYAFEDSGKDRGPTEDEAPPDKKKGKADQGKPEEPKAKPKKEAPPPRGDDDEPEDDFDSDIPR